MTSQHETVYQNSIITCIPHPVKKKSKSMKCMNCAWSTTGARKHPNIIYTMKRIYVKNRNTWKPVGWYCTRCGSVVLDKIKKPSFGYFKPPDPTIKVLKIEIL